jgi:protease IV
MKDFFKYMFASMVGFILGYIVIFSIMFFVVIGMITFMASESMKKISDHEIVLNEKTILKIDLRQIISEHPQENPFENFEFYNNEIGFPMSLKSVIDHIKKAKEDPNIIGIYLNPSYVPQNFTTLYEIRRALADFKLSKKFIYAYSDFYTKQGYYIASVADSVYLQPSGMIIFTGFGSEMMFFKGAFDKLEMEPKIIRAGKYKSAGESYTEYKMSKENYEQVSALINSIYARFINDIASSRKMDTATLRAIAAQFKVRVAQDAVTFHLADRLIYKDQFEDMMKMLTGKKTKDCCANYIALNKYIKLSKTKDSKSENKIALIYASGTIGMSDGGSESINPERLCEAIYKARTDNKIKAIVIRINSPGGSALASDIIWREVKLAKQAKPVIVSMGNVAASGGYYIACPADSIIAEPTTITGSIGVFGMFINMEKFWKNKRGVTFDRYKTDKYADFGNFTRPMTTDEEEIMKYIIGDIYTTFKTHVSEGRKMNVDSIELIAQGHVWTGEQALKIHLVDRLGSLDDALEMAKKMAKINDYKLVVLPKSKSPFEMFFNYFNMAGIKTYFMKQTLGNEYEIYARAKAAAEMNGIFMFMPYLPEFN